MVAAWWEVFLTYPCATCGAPVGEVCRTPKGKATEMPHAARTRNADRCPNCGRVTPQGTDPGALCPRCALIRSLEVERATKWIRQEPD